MSDYIPGSLQQTLFGLESSEINSGLDSLFKNSAGPAQVPKDLPINYVKNQVKNFSVNNDESDLHKKKHSWKSTKHICHIENVDSICEEKSHNKTLESKKKSVEEKYEIKVMKKEMKPSHKKVSRETDEEIDLNCGKHLKRKRSLKYQKRTEDITSNGSDSDKKSWKITKLDEDANVQHAETEISMKDSINSINSKTTNIDDNDKYKNEFSNATKQDDPERLQRTIFVGNLPVSVIQKINHKKLKILFSKFGKIESVRFRSIAFSELLPRKLAFITGKFHPERDVLNAYIVYKEPLSVQQAITMNAQVFLGRHLRVDSVAKPQNHDRRRTVFIGSLSFDAQEEELWLHFESCGEIESVRIVRDSKTNVGKGFAYVQFKERVSVELALKLNDTKLGTRKIRVTRCAKGNQVSKLDSYKVKPRIGKMKFGKELIEGIRSSKCKPEQGKSIQKNNKLVKQGTRTIKGKKRIRPRTQAWKKVQKKE